jgi:hypothetical protein
MTLGTFIRGLQVLRSHFDDDGHYVEATMEEVMVHATHTPLSDDEVTQLRDDGWFQPNAFDEETQEDGPYDPSDSWSCYA